MSVINIERGYVVILLDQVSCPATMVITDERVRWRRSLPLSLDALILKMKQYVYTSERDFNPCCLIYTVTRAYKLMLSSGGSLYGTHKNMDPIAGPPLICGQIAGASSEDNTGQNLNKGNWNTNIQFVHTVK